MDTELQASSKNDIKGAIGTGPIHATGGIKSSFHGAMYQVKLAMFFIVRALVNSFIFNIGTEVDAAESFDDLVFEFENEAGKRVVFLQAKHRLDEGKTVNDIDLLNETGHFSMRKYYSSYDYILGTKYFKETLKEAKVILVIFTNIGIDNSIQENFEEVEIGEFASNGFLNLGMAAVYAKCYKILPDTAFYNNLVQLLDKKELPLRLAKLLAKSVVNNKKKSIKIDNLFKRYRECLLHTIFDHGIDTIRQQNSYYVSFKEGFLLNKDLSVDLLKFRQEFIQCFISKRKNLNNQCVTDETIHAELSGVKFTVTKDFIIGGVNKQSRAKEFLGALIFAVNQPSEDKLGDIVEKEVGEYSGLIDRKSVTLKFYTYIFDWVKQKEGRFLKKADIEEQFAVWGQTDQSHRLINEIKSAGYTFKQDDVIVNISKFLEDESGQIICLYYSDQLFTKIKLCQAINYGRNISNEFIFTYVNTLSEQMNTRMCPVKAFGSQSCNNVFIIIRKKSEINQKGEMLLRRLLDIVKTDIRGKKAGKAKKRILILMPLKHATIHERKDLFHNIDSEGIENIILEDTEVRFSNLNNESKIKLFEKGLCKVEGNEVGGIVIDTLDDFMLQSIPSWTFQRVKGKKKAK